MAPVNEGSLTEAGEKGKERPLSGRLGTMQATASKESGWPNAQRPGVHCQSTTPMDDRFELRGPEPRGSRADWGARSASSVEWFPHTPARSVRVSSLVSWSAKAD